MPTTGGLGKEVYGGGAPYKARKKRRALKKVATNIKVRKPPVKQIGGGVAAPGPIKIPPRPTRGFTPGTTRKVGPPAGGLFQKDKARVDRLKQAKRFRGRARNRRRGRTRTY